MMRLHIERMTLDISTPLEDAPALAHAVAQRLAAPSAGPSSVGVLQVTVPHIDAQGTVLADHIAAHIARHIARAIAP